MQGNVACKVYLGGLKGDASLLLQAQHILHQEAICIVPGQEHIFDHGKHALLLEAQGLTPHHRGVDEVQAQCISSVLIQHLGRILHEDISKPLSCYVDLRRPKCRLVQPQGGLAKACRWACQSLQVGLHGCRCRLAQN